MLNVTSSGCFEGEFVKVLQSKIRLDLRHKHQMILLLQFVLLEIQIHILQRILDLLFALQVVFQLLRIVQMYLTCMLLLFFYFFSTISFNTCNCNNYFEYFFYICVAIINDADAVLLIDTDADIAERKDITTINCLM